MKIIDTHVHLGVSRFSGEDTTEDQILHAMAEYGIAASLVMPQPTREDISSIHERIAEMSRKNPGKVFGIASISPWMDEAAYRHIVEKCVLDYKFVALKLHPFGHNISPVSPLCNKVYELAQEFDIPVLVHTGVGNPNSLPSLMIDPAKRFPGVTFILSHAGFAVYTAEAVIAAKYCDNIILEPSWCPTFAVRNMINEIGFKRIIMGSDHMDNIPVELVKYRSISLTEEELEHIFFTNPRDIFKLDM